MNRCWARPLGDCSDRISGEHYVTAGLFEGDKLSVQGMAWCKTEIKEVGKKSLVKNVLCTGHNSKLSPFDDEAIQAFDVFRECARLTDVGQAMRARHWNVQRWHIDGALWLILSDRFLCFPIEVCSFLTDQPGRVSALPLSRRTRSVYRSGD
jgi:hypothetical protein